MVVWLADMGPVARLSGSRVSSRAQCGAHCLMFDSLLIRCFSQQLGMKISDEFSTNPFRLCYEKYKIHVSTTSTFLAHIRITISVRILDRWGEIFSRCKTSMKRHWTLLSAASSKMILIENSISSQCLQHNFKHRSFGWKAWIWWESTNQLTTAISNQPL